MERSGGASTVPTFIYLFIYFFTHYPPPQGTVRLKGAARTAAFRIAPYPSQESVASLQGPGVEQRVGAVPRFGQRPPPSAFPDSERGQRASRNGGPRRRWGLRVARSIAAGNSGLALSVRAPGLPAAPRPRPRLTLSDGDAVGELLRSLRGNPEPPRAAGASFPPPRRPPQPCAALLRPLCGGLGSDLRSASSPGPETSDARQELNLLRGPWVQAR